MSMQNGSAVGAANKSEFVFVKAHNNVKDLLTQFKLTNCSTRDEFIKNLGTAVNKLSN